MPPSLRALLDGLIDYAGLFPPASLPLDEAATLYARYRSGPDTWMLGRFIAPAARLQSLDGHVARFAGAPLRVSVLAPNVAAGDDATPAVVEAVAAARAFEARHPGRVVADRFEVRPPAGIDAIALKDLIVATDEATARAEGEPDRLFFEMPVADRAAMEMAALTVAAHNEHAGRPAAGIKLRLGGEAADAFPSVPELATTLVILRDAEVPFKATAGLHHPTRRAAPDIPGATMHGFVNVFGAAALAHSRRLDSAALQRVISEERLDRFVFDDDGFAWNGYGATANEVAVARQTFCTTFGSCSFDEPRDDLRAAGVMGVGNGRR
jgi:hypothetical protein